MSDFPNGWKNGRLADIAAKEYGLVDGPFGSNLKASEYVETGVPVIRGSNLSLDSTKFRDEGFVFVTEEKANELARSNCFPKDIIFTKKGTIGQTGIIPESARFPKYVLSSNQMKLTVDPELADVEYVYHYVSSPRAVTRIVNESGATGVPAINLAYLRSYPIPLPPLAEQRAIADILGTWDEAIAITEALIDALQQRKKGLMQKLLTGEVRFPEFDGEWNEVKLGELVDTFSGGTPSRSKDEYYGGEIPWIKSGEVNQTYIWETEETITEEGLNNSSAKLVEPDTVLVALYGATAGVVGISKIRATINQALLAVLPKPELLDKKFMFHSLTDDMPRIVHKFQQGGQPNLSATTVKSSNFRLPNDLKEQEKIAKVADILENEIRLYSDTKQHLQQQKKGLMQQLLTGQVRVKVD